MLARLARFSFRRRRIMVFAIWLPLLIGISAIGGAIGSNYHTDFNLPNSDSKVVQDALESGGNKEDAGWTAQIVFTSPKGTDDPAVKAAMEPFFAEVDKLDGVKVVSPYSPEGADFNSKTKPISFAQLSVTQRSQARRSSWPTRSRHSATRSYGRPVWRSSTAVSCSPAFELPESEILGILAAVIILLLAFGSVLAMGLPIGTALFGLGVGIGVVGIARHNACRHARVRAADGGDDRHRRRHRLRAVHRHPLPRGPARRHGAGGRRWSHAVDTSPAGR